MLDAAAITFDIDWAPDHCIEMCRDVCAEAGVPATFFATHESSVLTELLADPQFEVGIHPNFLPNSSHGESVQEVLDACLEMVPNASAMRTHALVQSTHILATVGDDYPQVKVDASLFLPFHPGLQPVDCHFGAKRRRLVRLPYYWEDDVAAEWPDWDWRSIPAADGGLKIFDFHPVFVALNIRDLSGYRKLKADMGKTPLFEATRTQVAARASEGAGNADFLKAVIDGIGADNFQTIGTITQRHLNGSGFESGCE